MYAAPLLALVLACLATVAPPATRPAGPQITSAAATADEVVLTLDAAPRVPLTVYALPIWAGDDVTRATPVPHELSGRVARLPRRGEGGADRLYRAFIPAAGDTPPRWEDARFVTDLSQVGAAAFPLPDPEGIKGLSCPVDLDDARAVGAVQLNHNIDVAGLFARAGDPDPIVREFDGREFRFDRGAVAGHDKEIGAYTRAGARVTAILLNGLGSGPASMPELVHPATDVEGAPMNLGGFNLATEKGFQAYAAAIDFLAERYSRPDAEHGLVANYIVGNEVTSHWIWNNFGRNPADFVIDHYERGLRVTDLAVRGHHEGARAFISSDNAWAARGAGDQAQAMSGVELIGGVAARARAGGDYPWGLAYHPYPSNLRDPRFWDDPLARRGMDSPRVTPLNIEVLSAYLRRPEMTFGGRARTVLFSEQGFNRPDEPDGEDVQAAAYALALWRMRQMPELEAFHLHRHVDHLREGGLLLGLWTADESAMPERADKPLKKVKLHEVFADMGTSREPRAIAFAEQVIGRPFESFAVSFDDVPEKGPVQGREGARWAYSLVERSGDAELDNLMDYSMQPVRSDEGVKLGVMEHPSDDGYGTATYAIDLPPLREGEVLPFTAAAVIRAPTDDGVRFSVSLDGEERWARTITDQTPVPLELDLAPWAGRQVTLTLGVDGLENTDYDWATWVDPLVVIKAKYNNSGAAGIEISREREARKADDAPAEE